MTTTKIKYRCRNCGDSRTKGKTYCDYCNKRHVMIDKCKKELEIRQKSNQNCLSEALENQLENIFKQRGCY